MQITIHKLLTPDSWDKNLSKNGGSLFLSQSWLSSVASEDKQLVYFEFIQNYIAIAMIAGLEIPCGKGPEKQLLFYSGIACACPEESLLRKCKISLLLYAKKNNYFRVILKSYDYHNYLTAGLNQFRKFKRSEFVIDLTKGTEEIRNCFSSDVKRLARKAEKNGAILGFSHSVTLLNQLFDLLEETKKTRLDKGYGDYRPLSIPLFTRKVIEQLLDKKHVTLYYVQQNDDILKINLMYNYLNRAYGLLMGTTAKGYRFGANSYFFYNIAFLLKEKGYAYFNLGSVPLGESNSGIRTFKESLGAKMLILHDETSAFINMPLKLLNPLLWLKSGIIYIRFPYKAKKQIVKLLDLIIRGKDQY